MLGSFQAAAAQPIASDCWAGPDHNAFDQILKDVVSNELVDYKKVQSKHLQALKGYLTHLTQINPEPLPGDWQLAYYINLYNATMIHAVVERYKPGYSPADDDYSVFSAPLVKLKERTLSLNELENELVRPVFKDPRIHIALVCGARSCPPLLPRAYRGEDLQATLEQGMRRFITHTSRNKVNLANKRVELSQIFNWYAQDFGGPEGVLAYIDRYHPDDLRGFKTEFIDYSWQLNDSAGG